MPNVYHHQRIIVTLDMGSPSSSDEEWASVKILIHRFADLPSAVGQSTLSPEFTCNGHRWCIKLYPSGHTEAGEGCLSLYLRLCSGGYATTAYEMSVLDKFQSIKHTMKSTRKIFRLDDSWGWKDFYPRDQILNQSTNMLDDNGTLAIVVSIKKDNTSPFVPNNPMSGLITSMFLDEETADVCFEVSTADVHDVDDGDEEAPSPVTFHAHRLILKTCAPMLASLFGSDDEEIVKVSINDVKPAIFRHCCIMSTGGA
ncbi:BTB/POZ and MATH domain-containing protein [Skeletonema marinoi]|uniref:BTB/POZ and MATH domain-containing protein n=1 Tax=Skeletonema marinoi TaxID=267567 RepID=A0AAD8Y446_9STRA|nr:BTB/POZ and MATH domain-containing protein [Skeletonema marinoi]